MMSKNASKHVLFAFGVNCTARGALKAGIPTSSSLASYTCFTVLVSVHVLRY